MSHMNDIPELYRRFDGNAGDYQEVRRGDLAADAQQRWPLVAAMASARVVMPPSVIGVEAVENDARQNMAIAAVPEAAGHTATAPCASIGVAGPTPGQDLVRASSRLTSSRRTSLLARLAAAWRTFHDEGRS